MASSGSLQAAATSDFDSAVSSDIFLAVSLHLDAKNCRLVVFNWHLTELHCSQVRSKSSDLIIMPRIHMFCQVELENSVDWF